KVETRMIWRASEDRWIFATYVWNDEQTDALLAPDGGIRNHAKIGEKAWHSIPSATDCSSCHDPSAKPVLGFSALQLSDDRDALAPHAKHLREGLVTIATLESLGLLSPRRPDLVANPPRIHSSSPRERAVLGYLSTNCGSCHNGDGPLSLLGMNLRQAGDGTLPAPAMSTTGDVAGHWRVPGLSPGESRRIAPGAPEASAIVYRMSSRHPSSRMPPIGSAVVDEDALALIREWVAIDLRSRQ
ncbi:MAG TPA: hypothetical protein VLD39_04760, partial [Gammaproteobacteria bacterium]|nr:hypothetical protein [Gammaproteobacteria bacterium]